MNADPTPMAADKGMHAMGTKHGPFAFIGALWSAFICVSALAKEGEPC